MITRSSLNRTACGMILTLCGFANLPAATFAVPSAECRTISLAMLKAHAGDTVLVAAGTYHDRVVVGEGVVLVAFPSQKATISAGGKGQAVTMAKNGCVRGFVITDAAIGVFSDGANNRILDCRIVRNWQSGIMALHGLPQIENNVIAFNRGAGIVLWDCRSLGTNVNHNTIACNDDNGILVGGQSEMTLANNIIALNSRSALHLNGIQARVAYVNNDLYDNLVLALQAQPNALGLDPCFIAPYLGNFTLAKTSPCIGRAADGKNLGAQVTE